MINTLYLTNSYIETADKLINQGDVQFLSLSSKIGKFKNGKSFRILLMAPQNRSLLLGIEIEQVVWDGRVPDNCRDWPDMIRTRIRS